MAAQQNDPKAQFNVGNLYDTGKGVKKDLKEAFRWYRKSAEQGYAPAQVMLGAMYALGDAVEVNFKDAMNWYLKAAKQNDAEAQRRLGYMYMNGEGVPTDYKKARKLYEEAAKQGYPPSLYWLGHLYAEGLGVKKDYSKAANYFADAAKAIMPEAQYRLGRICIEGKTKDCSKSTGLSWLRIAADLGNKEALEILKNFYNKGYPGEENGFVLEGTLNDALLDAARTGRTEDVYALLDKGANPNHKWHASDTYYDKSQLGRTPLHLAADKMAVEIVKILLENGSDPNAIDNRGFTPLMVAVPSKHQLVGWDAGIGSVDTVTALLNSGADPNILRYAEKSALESAAKDGQIEIAKLLIEHGAQVDVGSGYTALMFAAESGHIECVSLLLRKGANVNAKEPGGYNALSLAKESDHEYIVWLLKKYGATE